MKTKLQFDELIEDAPSYATHTATLASWSRNFGDSMSPFGLFLDIIGYPADRGYGPLHVAVTGEAFGYLECDMLADALKEYAARPQDVHDFVKQLCGGDDDDDDDDL